MTDNTQPEAGSTHIIRYALELGLLWVDGDGRDKVREALDALDALEAQLESIGAGGVSGPLMGQPQAMPDLTALTEHGAKAWTAVDAQALREGRWYMVTRDGVATLCEDRRDAEKEAKDADMAWPHSGPHRAVQLVEASTAGVTAADMATAEARGFRDGVASLSANAGEPWTGGEEWEALAWHLCAEENGEDACGELLWEGGPIPEPLGDRWMKYESDAKQMIELVRKFVAAPPTAQTEWWTRLPGALPEPGTPVLLDIGKKYPIRAMLAAKFTLLVGLEDDSGFGEHDERTDEWYCPEGWYEWNQCEDNHWRVTETPRAWMPLPPTSAEGVEHG